MGIDSSNVRRVIHWGPPEDVEMCVQQSGRAERDGNMSYALIIYNPRLLQFRDVNIIQYCKNKDK